MFVFSDKSRGSISVVDEPLVRDLAVQLDRDEIVAGGSGTVPVSERSKVDATLKRARTESNGSGLLLFLLKVYM